MRENGFSRKDNKARRGNFISRLKETLLCCCKPTTEPEEDDLAVSEADCGQDGPLCTPSHEGHHPTPDTPVSSHASPPSPLPRGTEGVNPQAPPTPPEAVPLSHPEAAPPSHPEAAPPSHPEAAPPSHPEAVPPSHPEAVPPSHQEAAPPSHPEAAPPSHPEAAPPSHPEAVPPSHPEAVPPSHQEAAPPSHPEAVPPSHPEAAPPSHPEAAPPSHPEAAPPSHPEATPPSHPEDAPPSHPEAAPSSPPNVGHTVECVPAFIPEVLGSTSAHDISTEEGKPPATSTEVDNGDKTIEPDSSSPHMMGAEAVSHPPPRLQDDLTSGGKVVSSELHLIPAHEVDQPSVDEDVTSASAEGRTTSGQPTPSSSSHIYRRT
ncbi:uncharacterized protein LOC135462498 [Liolophura sinensis]|uniref:uncharacterized protein LOC135462498 n=1 Tax=Liolophura sinensis TaxID=3198878 RepID=UPI003158FAFB